MKRLQASQPPKPRTATMTTTTMGPIGRLRTGFAARGAVVGARRGAAEGGTIGDEDVYDPSSIASSKILGWLSGGGTYGVSRADASLVEMPPIFNSCSYADGAA